jgi:hypothetical protein
VAKWRNGGEEIINIEMKSKWRESNVNNESIINGEI